VAKRRKATKKAMVTEPIADVSVPAEDTFGSRLKELRKGRGLSQVELARRLGLHQSLISQYECGYLRLHGALLVRLAQALETTPDEILTAASRTAATAEPPIDRRFLRRLKQVEKLSAHQKKLLLGTIDAFLSKVS
jgi:transcriptional regulator with XRE-family HTH domain